MTKISNLFLVFFVSFSLFAQSAKVIGIKDGDTIELLLGGRPVTVRLNGIDCPEKHQAYGQRAKQFTSDKCFGKTVSLRSSGTDRYGRTLGEIILPDGKSLNRELLRNGYAWWYRQYSSDQSLAALEQQARSQRLGLWQDPNPIPPWDFRHSNTQQCTATTKRGTQCSRTSQPGSLFCFQHGPLIQSERCQATTRKGTQCSRRALSGSRFCFQHNH